MVSNFLPICVRADRSSQTLFRYGAALRVTDHRGGGQRLAVECGVSDPIAQFWQRARPILRSAPATIRSGGLCTWLLCRACAERRRTAGCPSPCTFDRTFLPTD